ncbi:helix-turn-helix transcriptional regulator [Burkholderia pseudomallei]|nr:AlpA family phage regulatory protein [Burkholderia pseudomallei]
MRRTSSRRTACGSTRITALGGRQPRMTVAMKPIYLDIASVSAAVSLSPAVIHKLVRQEEFPRPRALSGRRVGWLTREVEEWAEARTPSEFLPPPNCGTGRRKATIDATG